VRYRRKKLTFAISSPDEFLFYPMLLAWTPLHRCQIRPMTTRNEIHAYCTLNEFLVQRHRKLNKSSASAEISDRVELHCKCLSTPRRPVVIRGDSFWGRVALKLVVTRNECKLIQRLRHAFQLAKSAKRSSANVISRSAGRMFVTVCLLLTVRLIDNHAAFRHTCIFLALLFSF